MNIRALQADEVEFSLEIEDEDVPVEGNASATDDPEEDAKLVAEIQQRLDRGDLWAWCCVKVTAKWKHWRGVDYLGACSYESEADFKHGGYWEDMKSQALAALNRAIAEDVECLEFLKAGAP